MNSKNFVYIQANFIKIYNNFYDFLLPGSGSKYAGQNEIDPFGSWFRLEMLVIRFLLLSSGAHS